MTSRFKTTTTTGTTASSARGTAAKENFGVGVGALKKPLPSSSSSTSVSATFSGSSTTSASNSTTSAAAAAPRPRLAATSTLSTAAFKKVPPTSTTSSTTSTGTTGVSHTSSISSTLSSVPSSTTKTIPKKPPVPTSSGPLKPSTSSTSVAASLRVARPAPLPTASTAPSLPVPSSHPHPPPSTSSSSSSSSSTSAEPGVKSLRMVDDEDEESEMGSLFPADKVWSLNDFDIGKVLGSGMFGKVYLAREKTTNFVLALKMIYKAELLEHRMTDQLIREIRIQMKLNHKNILKMYNFFQDDTRIFLMLEYAAQGELYRHLRRAGTFPEARAANIIESVAEGLAYCHSKSVIHRDLKPENILLDIDGSPKLADFGWAVNSNKRRKTVCGTLDYLPPEIVMNKGYNRLVDAWSLGILAYELLVGKPPFESETDRETLRLITSNYVKVEFPEGVSAEARDLIEKLVTKDAERRIEVERVLDHPWIKRHSPSHL